jgi:hypothetical protein
VVQVRLIEDVVRDVTERTGAAGTVAVDAGVLVIVPVNRMGLGT